MVKAVNASSSPNTSPEIAYASKTPMPGGATGEKVDRVAGSRLKQLILKHADTLQLGSNIQRIARGSAKSRANFERQALSPSSLTGSEKAETFAELIQNVKTLLKGHTSGILHKLSSSMLTAKAGVDVLNTFVGDDAYFGAVVGANMIKDTGTDFTKEIGNTAYGLDLIASTVGTAASLADGVETLQAVKTKRKLEKLLADSKARKASPEYLKSVQETQSNLRYRMRDLRNQRNKLQNLRENLTGPPLSTELQTKIHNLEMEIHRTQEDVESLTAKSIELHAMVISPKNTAKIQSTINRLDKRIHENAKQRCLMGAANVAYLGGSVAAKVATGTVASTLAIVGGSILFGVAHFANNELSLAKEKKTAKKLDHAIDKYSTIMMNNPDKANADGHTFKGTGHPDVLREYSKPMLNISSLKTLTLMASKEKYTKSNIRMRNIGRTIGPSAILAGSLALAGVTGPFGAIPLAIGITASIAMKVRTTYKQNFSTPIARRRSKVALNKAKASFQRGLYKFGLKCCSRNSKRSARYKEKVKILGKQITSLNLKHQKLLAVELISSSAPKMQKINKRDSKEVVAKKEKFNSSLATAQDSETAINIKNILSHLSDKTLSTEQKERLINQAIGEVEDVARSFTGKCFLPTPPPGRIDPTAKAIKEDIAKKYDLFDENGKLDSFQVTTNQVIAWMADYGMQ